MADTNTFRTKTDFIQRDNGKLDGKWTVGIDVGYSAVKVFSPNCVSRFPSYARRIKDDFSYIGAAPDYSILYRDDDSGEQWIVGRQAQELVSSSDTSDSEAALYGRERYQADMFRVISQTGLGAGCTDNNCGSVDGRDIVIQTGLPDKYMSDKRELVDVFSGHHRFSLKIGKGDWKSYNIAPRKDDIHVMSQPSGTLFSICIAKDGKFHKKAMEYLHSSVIVFDPGFGTLDIFPIDSGTVGTGQTYSDLGMRRVLQETARMIEKEYGAEISVPALQNNLASGKIRVVDYKNFTSSEKEFGDLLLKASDKVCDEAIKRVASAVPLADYNYLIVTGGTGHAWYERIRDRFKNFGTLSIIPGNQNDSLPFVYSNVRGYYFYRFNRLGQEARHAR